MSDKVFVDSNVWVYSVDQSDAPRRVQAKAVIEEYSRAGAIVISTQVLGEVYSVITRKLGVPHPEAKNLLSLMGSFRVVQVTPELIERGADVSVLNQLRFWDALMVSAAEEAGCSAILSEDLQSGGRLLGMEIRNPFHGS